MNILTKAISRAFVEQEYEDETFQTNKELGKIIEIPISEIRPNSSQPRKNFDRNELTSLAKSISQDGIIQPLSVRIIPEGYELISGERRLRASKIAGLKFVPCIIINADDKRSEIISLIENIQRKDLDFLEEAEAISQIMKNHNMTQEETAIRLGFAQSTVANKLRLLKLSSAEKKIITDNNLTERHARAILKIQNQQQRKEILEKIIKNKWTVKETEKYIEGLEKEKCKKENYKKRAVMLKDVRLFFNTVNKAIDVMKLAGVDANAKRVDHKDYIEYIIKIPNEQKKDA